MAVMRRDVNEPFRIDKNQRFGSHQVIIDGIEIRSFYKGRMSESSDRMLRK